MAGKMNLKNKKFEETRKLIEQVMEDIKANIKDIDEVVIAYDNDEEEILISYLDREVKIDYNAIDDDTLQKLDDELFILAHDKIERDLIEYLKSKGIRIMGVDEDEDAVVIKTEDDDIIYDYYEEKEINTNNYHILITRYIFKVDESRVNEILEDC